MNLKKNNEYKAKKEKELSSSLRSDTIFIGLQLGMSQEQYKSHIAKMILDSSFILEDSLPVYLLDLENEKTGFCKLVPSFHNDSLYNLTVYVDSEERYVTISYDSRNALKSLFIEKYGSQYIEKSHPLGITYSWIHNNRKIELHFGDLFTKIKYIDINKFEKVFKDELEKDKKEYLEKQEKSKKAI